MTRDSHLMVMTRRLSDRVRIAEFKARLSEYLRAVRRGSTLTVLDRDTPIARVVPYEEGAPLRVRAPAGRYRRVGDVPMPSPLAVPGDIVELLLEERQAER